MTTDDFVEDVSNAARMVRQDARFGSVFLFGHSEGAQLVVQAANRGAPADGVIMASGMGRRLAAVLHDQFLNLIDSAQVAGVDSSFQKFLRGEEYGEVPVAARVVFVPLYRVYLNSMAAYDAVAEIRAAKQPVLIVHGSMDLQTPDADANRLRAARPDATYLLIPAANHVYKHTVSREVNAQLPSYRDLTMPIVPDLAPGVGAWILRIANRGSGNQTP